MIVSAIFAMGLSGMQAGVVAAFGLVRGAAQADNLQLTAATNGGSPFDSTVVGPVSINGQKQTGAVLWLMSTCVLMTTYGRLAAWHSMQEG